MKPAYLGYTASPVTDLMTASSSSSSSSSALDMLIRPSEDAERRGFGWDGVGEEVDKDEEGRRKWRAVMWSEWVEA